MDKIEAKQIMDSIIAKTTSADDLARLELIREYVFNTEFRTELETYLFEQFVNRQAALNECKNNLGIACATVSNAIQSKIAKGEIGTSF